MGVQLQFEQGNGYLVARFIGDGPINDVRPLFDSIVEECERVDQKKVLIDYTGASVNASIAERYEMGKVYLIFARHKLKVASLVTAEQIDSKKFTELVARNRGAVTRVFMDRESAEEWLLL
jgi:CO dehydrogenase/acetyl-CoA synthase delta subunit